MNIESGDVVTITEEFYLACKWFCVTWKLHIGDKYIVGRVGSDYFTMISECGKQLSVSEVYYYKLSISSENWITELPDIEPNGEITFL